MKELIKFITDLMSRKFYGKVIISFENGKITHLKKEESIKL